MYVSNARTCLRTTEREIMAWGDGVWRNEMGHVHGGGVTCGDDRKRGWREVGPNLGLPRPSLFRVTVDWSHLRRAKYRMFLDTSVHEDCAAIFRIRATQSNAELGVHTQTSEETQQGRRAGTRNHMQTRSARPCKDSHAWHTRGDDTRTLTHPLAKD